MAFVDKDLRLGIISIPSTAILQDRSRSQHVWLAIIERSGQATGYALPGIPSHVDLRWMDPDEIRLNGTTFNLRKDPPHPIH